MDYVLPESLDPMVKTMINFLVGFHLLAFLIFIVLLARSFKKSPEDNFREQYQTMEQKVKQKNLKNNKQD